MTKTRRTDKRRERVRLALLGGMILSAACSQPELSPVDIRPEDMCSMCRMAISQKQYAAEFITRDGDVFKFDDIGCLQAYLKEHHHDNITAHFVVDFDSGRWIKAGAAYFVRSPEIKTPMQGGIAAFGNQSRAEETAARYRVRVLRFDDLPD